MHVSRNIGHRHITAIVEEVLPATGLAYLTGDNESTWAVTRSTPGVGLDKLQRGQRVDLTLTEHGDFSVASAYTPLD